MILLVLEPPQAAFAPQSFSPEQAGLLYQEEKIATHHVLPHGLQAQPQVLVLGANFATDQRLYGKLSSTSTGGLPGRKTAIFLWENQ